MFFLSNMTNITNIVHSIIPSVENEWTYTNFCYSCNSKFGFIQNKQHHCRCCGRCFCSNCCKKMIEIPLDLISCPQEQKTYKSTVKNLKGYIVKIDKENKKNVCDDCYSKISYILSINVYIHILLYSDLKTIITCLLSFRDMRNAALYVLEKIRNTINGCDNNNDWGRNMIIQNIDYLAGHSCIYKKFTDFFINFTQKRIINCNTLNCPNYCRENVGIIDFFEIMTKIVRDGYKDNSAKNLYNIASNVVCDITELHLLFPLFCPLIVNLFDGDIIRDDNVSDKIFELLICDEKTLCSLLNYVNNMINKPNILINALKKYISGSGSKYYNVALYKKMVARDNFIYNKLFETPSVNWEFSIDTIRSCLPVLYPFDDNYNITQINDFHNVNDYKFGTFGNRCIKLELEEHSMMCTVRRKKNVLLMMKGMNKDEYRNYIMIKLIIEKCKIKDFYINDICFLKKGVYLVEMHCNTVNIEKINIKDHIYSTNIDRQLGDILCEYANSLALLYVFSKLFDINIFDKKHIVITGSKIYFAQYVFTIKNFSTNVNESCDEFSDEFITVLGTKSSIFYRDFIRYYRENLMMVQKIRDDLVNSFMINLP